MMSSTTPKRGDLVLVPYPFSDLSATKRRPVLALTEPDGYGDFLGVAVTSRPHHALAIVIGPDALAAGRLPTTSWIRVDRIVTLNVALVTRVFGTVTDDLLLGAVRAICERIGYRKG